MKIFLLGFLVFFSLQSFSVKADEPCEVWGELPRYERPANGDKNFKRLNNTYMEDLGINSSPFRRYCKCSEKSSQTNCINKQKANLVNEFGSCEFSVKDYSDPFLKGLNSVDCYPLSQNKQTAPKKVLKVKHQ